MKKEGSQESLSFLIGVIVAIIIAVPMFIIIYNLVIDQKNSQTMFDEFVEDFKKCSALDKVNCKCSVVYQDLLPKGFKITLKQTDQGVQLSLVRGDKADKSVIVEKVKLAIYVDENVLNDRTDNTDIFEFNKNFGFNPQGSDKYLSKDGKIGLFKLTDNNKLKRVGFYSHAVTLTGSFNAPIAVVSENEFPLCS